ncbi:hypothetical protein EOM39_02975 [Candidatus Gracilibacteria bacterium]|nr:hypothetical protein [Candidatus Gracilibacteria bacterium]
MKNLKNKFIFSIIFLILFIIGFETYSFYSIRDTKSYITLTDGKGFIDEKELIIKEREVVSVGNIIKTVGDESIAVIEWGDSSITRLGGNTEVEIKENNISSNLSKIQISLNLIKGKTRNNLVSIFGKESYFKHYVNDIEAGVRGTTFEINKEKDYVYVENHEIKLINTKTSKEVTLSKEKPMKLSTFTLLELQEFLLKIKDKTWQEINKKMDKELISSLKDGLTKQLKENNPIDFILSIFFQKYSVLYDINAFKDIENVKNKINKLNDSDKKYIYDKVFSRYQSINFLTPEDENYDKKLYYKEILLATSYDEKNTESLIKNSLYDINDIVSSNNLSKLKDSIDFLVNNKDQIDKLNIDFNKYVDTSKIPDSLKDSMIKSLEPLKEIFKNTPDLENILNFGEKIKDKAGGLIDSIKQ